MGSNVSWIKLTDCVVPERAAILAVTLKDMLMLKSAQAEESLRSSWARFSTAQELMQRDRILEAEEILLGLIEEHQPQLKGCQIIACQYAMHRMEYQILVTHPSLAPVDNAMEAPRRRLFFSSEDAPEPDSAKQAAS